MNSEAPRKKLIEVALPLEAINKASAREKSIRHGHPSTLHLWWARRPLAACRAVLFASLVDDPSSHPELFPTDADQEKERKRLFAIIEDLVQWENSNNEHVLNAARAEILKSTNGKPPPVLDPFCGGGSIPLEAQRLGLEAHGSDLNPVAVLITRALIEIPPKFAGRPPVHPGLPKTLTQKEWPGATGLAEDVRYYGNWMRDEAAKRIGHLYPKVKLPKEHGGGEAPVIAWLWARTVQCPNPACGAMTPLVKSLWLSKKPGNRCYLSPRANKKNSRVDFSIETAESTPSKGSISRRGGVCLACSTPIPLDRIRSEGKAGRLGTQLLAIVAERDRKRMFLPACSQHIDAAESATPKSIPDAEMADNPFSLRPPLYGLRTFGQLFTQRQLLLLETLCDVVSEIPKRLEAEQVESDARSAMSTKEQAREYSRAVMTYLGEAISKTSAFHCTAATWRAKDNKSGRAFGRQAIAMTWDYAEVNPFAEAGGSLEELVQSAAKTIGNLPARPPGSVVQHNASTPYPRGTKMVSTDPPYYNNVDYADLSDFYYIWLRPTLSSLYPELFSTLVTPKDEEIVATPYRFQGDKTKAERFFEERLSRSFAQIKNVQDASYPLTVYYAFKQAEADEEEDDEDVDDASNQLASTGWETMLEGLLRSGFQVCGTWPMRTESTGGLKNVMNSLASSIVLACRPRPDGASTLNRAQFLAALKRELPDALKKLQHGNIAPVDLAQASIGPGMAIFSRYGKVLEADGSAMTVRTALQIINQALDEVLSEQESEYDGDTRWAIAWFDQHGLEEGQYGVAETLSKAKNTSVNGLSQAGILVSKAGKVRLLKRDELPDDWDPAEDERLTVWEITQHLIRALEKKGESGAADLLRKVGSKGEVARDLAYRLYSTCERKKWAQEALAYNSLVIVWPQISKLAQHQPEMKQRGDLFS